ATVADLAARWAAEGWPARADDTGLALTAEYSAPSAGPPRGTCTASRRARRQRWAPSIPEARRGGGSSRTGPWQRIERASAARWPGTRRPALGGPSAEARREGARPADLARRPGDRRRVVEGELGDPGEPCFQRDPEFHPRQVRSHAAVDAQPERGVPVDLTV